MSVNASRFWPRDRPSDDVRTFTLVAVQGWRVGGLALALNDKTGSVSSAIATVTAIAANL